MLLTDAHDRILDSYDQAALQSKHCTQFIIKADAALLMFEDAGQPEAALECLRRQRSYLEQNQRSAKWRKLG